MDEKFDLNKAVSDLVAAGKITQFMSILKKKYSIEDKVIENITKELMTISTISFCVCDDLRPDEIITKSFKNKEELTNILKEIWKIGTEKYSHTYFFDNISIESVVDDLLTEGYCVYNRREKYYVVAFAINYKRFWIWSKDCEAKIIKWKENDENDCIAKNLEEDYDVNPVIKMMSKLK